MHSVSPRGTSVYTLPRPSNCVRCSFGAWRRALRASNEWQGTTKDSASRPSRRWLIQSCACSILIRCPTLTRVHRARASLQLLPFFRTFHVCLSLARNVFGSSLSFSFLVFLFFQKHVDSLRQNVSFFFGLYGNDRMSSFAVYGLRWDEFLASEREQTDRV